MDEKSDILSDIDNSFDLSSCDDLVRLYIAVRLAIIAMKCVRRCIDGETKLDLSK